MNESLSPKVEAQCEKHVHGNLSFQFRENVQDVLPALPNPDDYFLLRWLRGERGGGDIEDEGTARGSPQCHNNLWLSGSCFTCSSLGKGRKKQSPPQAPIALSS